MIGYIALGVVVIALLTAFLSIILAANAIAAKSREALESARLASLSAFPLLSLAVIGLLSLLVTGQFQYASVYLTTDTTLPLYLKLAALWGGQEGSLLFWCWLLSGFIFVALIRRGHLEREETPWVIILTSLILAFFLAMVLFFENPFLRFYVNMEGQILKSVLPLAAALPILPDRGLGMNPLLYHIGMVFHPPMLYLGFVGFVIPFAYAMAALIRGQKDDEWIRRSQKWALVAWLFLTIGLVLGSRWAYDVLGWGGYWGWDPVEVAALMPWLTGTAYLHSSLIQEKRGVFKHWSVALIILTFCLVILGTFLTRSGLLSSVHAFSQSAVGPFFFGFTALMLIGSLVLLALRWTSLKSGFHLDSYFSRESLFLFNNLLFVAIFLICLTGVLFPIFSELLTGQQVTVGPPFYQQATGPLFAVLLLLMGVVPLSTWSASTGRSLGKNLWKPALISLLLPLLLLLLGVRAGGAILALWVVFLSILITLYDYGRSVLVRKQKGGSSLWKALRETTSGNRRRYGAYIIHLGIALMGLGVIGIEFFQTQTQVTLKKNESVEISGYTLSYRGLLVDSSPADREIARAEIQVEREGRTLAWLYPGRDYYYAAEQNVTTPGLRSTPVDDLYIILVDWLPVSSEGTTFKIYRNPLVFWLWIGTLVLMAGTLVALWPRPRQNIAAKGSA
ncbi:MAG: heme lyase CcmF/NrfE family subunit [Chloroflexi bacterium]|nr:heme lyase CcmF/NrfE family subunit [Chloroflexota bacterium]